jgi:tRNA (cytidine56-2'-O)-methyltransferase
MISILRLGHRQKRDERVSTHVGLCSRALGASEITYCGEEDAGIIESVRNVTARWGGPFSAKYEQSWKKAITSYKKRKFCICHLTMYGMPLKKKIAKIRKSKNVLVVVGSEKVPHEVYQLADYNIAVSSQPHSEVAALAIFLHELQKGKELDKKFKKAIINIEPMEKGKKIIEKGKKRHSIK